MGVPACLLLFLATPWVASAWTERTRICHHGDADGQQQLTYNPDFSRVFCTWSNNGMRRRSDPRCASTGCTWNKQYIVSGSAWTETDTPFKHGGGVASVSGDKVVVWLDSGHVIRHSQPDMWNYIGGSWQRIDVPVCVFTTVRSGFNCQYHLFDNGQRLLQSERSTWQQTPAWKDRYEWNKLKVFDWTGSGWQQVGANLTAPGGEDIEDRCWGECSASRTCGLSGDMLWSQSCPGNLENSKFNHFASYRLVDGAWVRGTDVGLPNSIDIKPWPGRIYIDEDKGAALAVGEPSKFAVWGYNGGNWSQVLEMPSIKKMMSADASMHRFVLGHDHPKRHKQEIWDRIGDSLIQVGTLPRIPDGWSTTAYYGDSIISADGTWVVVNDRTYNGWRGQFYVFQGPGFTSTITGTETQTFTSVTQTSITETVTSTTTHMVFVDGFHRHDLSSVLLASSIFLAVTGMA